ncbi:hypothetical protein ALQ28_03886 [Pseudomonas syringae pv. delphinii]|uniref:Uncharacterized protein n=1 Tax=Pseudomonas syringae pv. delphinii TaxID=192088 RepID=A0A3M4BGI7_9PSED|nr:hypothetical protein [Pseudomonas syringae group genomosp. 3]RMP18269.1 hypothetical protein ALQ28_03886 [Pseudomonas syringae pv. delphinii]
MKKQINVQKATPTELFAKQAPYSSVSNDVVAMIVNPDALAIWAYLQTRSSDWKVIGSYLQERFSIGRDRYSKAMAYLKEIGLVTHEIMREEGTGKVLGRRVIVHYEPNLQVSHTSVDRSVGSPNCGKTDHYLIKDSSTELSEKEPMVANAPSRTKAKTLKFDPLNSKPANVSESAWSDWCQHRKEIRKPLTATTCTKQAKTLAGHPDADAVINQSISNGWTGLFPESVLPGTSAKNGKPSRHTQLDQVDHTDGLELDANGNYRIAGDGQ